MTAKARSRATDAKGAVTSAAPARPVLSLVKPLKPTETRAYQALRVHAAQATFYAGACGIHAPFDTWTGLGDGTATALVDDDLRLIYTPGQDGGLTAYTHCPNGHGHTRPVDSTPDLLAFRHDLEDCTGAPPRHLADQPTEHPQ